MKGSITRGRASLALGLSLAACAAATFWIANGVAPWDGDRSNAWHQYEYLAEGFLHGHTYLSIEPDPQLLRLKDPYDPAQNGPWRLWDASLFHGKYYLYQGPTPAILLMLPWRIVTGHALPQRLAVAAFAVAGLAGLALLLWEVRRRHFPGLSGPALGAIVVVAFHASWLPVTLRRSALWELPIVAAAACLWWTLYFLWKYHDSGGRARWAVAAGATLALLMGSRVTYVSSAAAVALLLLVPAEVPGAGLRRRWGGPCLAAALAAAGGIALLAYNHARFGSWTEFGLGYTLFGEDYRGIPVFNTRFIPFDAWTYLLALPSFGPYFPFLHPFWTDSRPAGFVGFEEMYGVLFMMPVHLAGLAALAWAWRHRSARGMRATGLTLAAALLASVFAGLTLFCWAWACSRFINELLAGWTVATAVGMMVAFGSGPGGPGRLVRFLAAGAALWTVACVWLASAEFRGFMRQTDPRTYAALAHALDYPSQWWARSHGIHYGPVDLVIVAPSAALSQTVLLASGRPQRVNRLLVDTLGGGRVRLSLAQNDHPVLSTPELSAAGGRLGIRLNAPWLYPPPEHPYWDAIADPALRRDRQTLFSMDWGSGSARVNSTRTVDPVAFEPAVQLRGLPQDASPYVESLGPAPPGP
jgi:hypothetical protein